MQRDLLSYLDGKENLWKRMLLNYPAKLNEQLSPEDKELQIFLVHSVIAMDVCFDPCGDQKVYDLDIYNIKPTQLIDAYDLITESLLCFYFFEHGYHPHLVKKYCDVKNQVNKEVGGENFLYNMYKNASNNAYLTRDCYLDLADIFNLPAKQKNVLDLYATLQVCYSNLISDLKHIDKVEKIDLSLLKLDYEFDNKSSC